MAKRKQILNAALKALLAGLQTSKAIKISSTFISELASLPDDKQKVLGELSQEQFNELLTQSELAALNAADAAVRAQQIKDLVQKLDDKATEILRDIRDDVKYIRDHLPDKNKILKENGPIHNLPYTSIGDLLKGRDDALKTLDQRLSSANHTVAAITQPQAVHGLGGVGKSRLAVEYAWHVLKNNKVNAALFVIADSETALNSNLAALASPEYLNLPEHNQKDQSVTVKAVLSCLASRNDYLIIFDNVDAREAREYIMKILPHLSSGKVIITSRASNWPHGIADLSIDKLSTADAAAYLLQTTENKRAASKDDNHLAAQLADKLDGLPIALEQAAAYISHRHISFQTYLNEFESSRKEILSWHKPELMSYPASVIAVWQSSIKQLSPPACAVLYLSSLLSPEPIPVSLFESAVPKLSDAIKLLVPQPHDEIRTTKDEIRDIRSILAELADYSLIKLTESSFTIHRLVQDSIRLSIPEKSLKSFTQIILGIVNDCIPAKLQSEDVRSWHIWKPIEPHLSALLLRPDCLEIPEPTGYLSNSLAIYLKTLARFTEAELLMRRSLEIAEKSFGKNHPNVATVLNNLALLLQATNRPKDAEPLMRRALEIDESFLSKNHPNVARDLNNLAELLRETGRYKEAEPLYRRALGIYEKSLDPEHLNVASVLNNLAQLLQDTNRFIEAEPIMRRVIEIFEKSLGPDHPNVATALNNLAGLYQAMNRKDEAKKLYERAVKIFEDSFGPDHPQTITTRRNLASLG
jgi:tetratricopeptide (TPR) repeat protein